MLDRWGHVRETLSGNGINGPWDMTAISNRHFAQLFVTNVLNGTVAANGTVVNKGTVLRLTLALYRHHAPHLLGTTTIGSGFGQRTDPAALVVGPTGVGLNSHGTLFVADSLGNRITAIPGAPFRNQQRRDRVPGHLGRRAEHAAGAHRGPEREHPHRQRR